MKLAAEADYRISSQAFRILSRLISRIYTDRYRYANEQFPLSHRTVNQLLGSGNQGRLDMGQDMQPNPKGTSGPAGECNPLQQFAGCSEKTAYRRIRELERALYVERTELRGCPPTSFYKLQIGRFYARKKHA
jgi:hypothetical protein